MRVVVDIVKANGFDWDDANIYKVYRRGLSIDLVEEFFSRELLILPDYKHSEKEDRFVAFGKSLEGRYMRAVFTMRKMNDQDLIRVVTARYMHKREVKVYEEIKKNIKT